MMIGNSAWQRGFPWSTGLFKQLCRGRIAMTAVARRANASADEAAERVNRDERTAPIRREVLRRSVAATTVGAREGREQWKVGGPVIGP